MKRLFFLGAICIATTLFACSSDNHANLPNAANLFLQQHFPNNNIIYVERDLDHGRFTYEVHLQDLVEIEFNNKGEWTEISCPNGVPDGLVPTPIYEFVEINYTNCFIVKIERKSHHYQIELNNDIDLVFDSKGNFIRFD